MKYEIQFPPKPRQLKAWFLIREWPTQHHDLYTGKVKRLVKPKKNILFVALWIGTIDTGFGDRGTSKTKVIVRLLLFF
ncbi:MAG TPA: hypothetical protein P5096_03365 [Patescibacteria group bacterium]|nr:hypothetical protein [Patescibacteria group bacterium]